MFDRTKGIVIACGMAVVLFSAPSESKALFCNWFGCGTGCGLFGCNRTTYRPLFSGVGACAAPACSPCATQTCSYQPQTCYRTQCVNVPVTTYRPVTSCDPCTGCPVTTLRPTTAFVRQVRYLPYTTYRPVCTTGCAPVATAVAAPVATSYYPTTIQANAAPAASCCTPATPISTVTPSVAVPSTMAPVASTPITVVPNATPPANMGMPSTVIPPTPTPSLDAAPYNGGSTAQPYQDLKPIPETNQRSFTPNNSNGDVNSNGGANGSSSSYPLLRDPYSRTTSLPQSPAPSAERSLVTPAVFVSPAAPDEETLDDSGWHAARR